ncbi:hypothetical protein TYRP_000765 [Tyrophagus putrescentiae]|nr:hypothetical protein TYRP_000765 [Tyrophagus putrescentiae]
MSDNNNNTDSLTKKKSRSSSSNQRRRRSKSRSSKRSKSKKKEKIRSKSSSSKHSAKKPKSKQKKPTSKKRTENQEDQQQQLDTLKIGFFGAGKMTESIQLFVAAKSERNLGHFSAHQNITTTRRPYDLFGRFDCDLVFLAVHGHAVRACYKGGGTRPSALFVNYLPKQGHPLTILSLVGGVSLAELRPTLLDPDDPEKYLLSLFRLCLNAAVRYGLGLGAIDVDLAEEEEEENNSQGKLLPLPPPVVLQLLRPILGGGHRLLEYCPEPQMDAFCALTGNGGLAFVFYLISAMASGGAKVGLNKVMAVRLATYSLQSAARSLLLGETGKGTVQATQVHPSELQDRITSEGGAAAYGLQLLEEQGVGAGLQAALEGALGRIRQLVTTDPVGEVEVKAVSFPNA